MRPILPFACIILSITLLTACATSTPYQPAASDRATGYTDYAIESNRYRVVYRASSPQRAEDFALRRAAELTVQNGYDWFDVVSRSRDAGAASSGVSPRVSVGASTGGYSGLRVGTGIGVNLGSSGSQSVASLEILMGSGPRPEKTSVYDANSILTSMAAY